MDQIHWDFLARILIGALLGGIIGYERDIHGRAAGLRTHLIVAMASSTFMVLSAHFMAFQHYTAAVAEHVDADSSRIAASVVSGIGFLAGGAILRNGVTVQGLTTAAGLWLVTAIGLCAGAGMFAEAGFVTLLGFVALAYLRKFERKQDDQIKYHVSLTITSSSNSVNEILKALGERGILISNFEYQSWPNDSRLEIRLDVCVPKETGHPQLIDNLESLDNIERVHVQAAA